MLVEVVATDVAIRNAHFDQLLHLFQRSDLALNETLDEHCRGSPGTLPNANF